MVLITKCRFSKGSLIALSAKSVLSCLSHQNNQIEKVKRRALGFVHAADDFVGNNAHFKELVKPQIEAQTAKVTSRRGKRIVKSIGAHSYV
jgi:hypothetical protein